MPIDALFLSAAAEELRESLIGARVDKIQQPEKDVLLLSLRGPAGPCKLLISAGGSAARMHLTSRSRENPSEPPMLCMLLRKHLSGARILSLEQPDHERMYLLRFACLDELGVASEKQLAVEMIGRSANLILIDGEGRILDCLRKVDAEQSPRRQLLPGLYYALPPRQERPGFFETTPEDFVRCFSASQRLQGEKPGDTWLISTFAGVSPLLARELCFRASGCVEPPLRELDPSRLLAASEQLRQPPFHPTLLARDGQPFDVYCQPPLQYGAALEQRPYDSFSALLDDCYTERERSQRQSQRSSMLTKLVKNRHERAARKLAVRREERKATAQREQWRQYGDLIKANLYRMKRGEQQLVAENFYAEDGGEIRIPLDPRLSPQQNAARYYKLYSKAKNAEKVLAVQIAEAETELNYLDSVLEALSLASGERDLSEIRQELADEGYLRENGGRKKQKRPQPQPIKYRTAGGVRILVGRNNVQNDWLTLKAADRNSFWFHAQKTHGAHVVVACDPEDREAMEAAALLAAWYSSARDSAQVAVDYTRVGRVRKPAGAKPGMVIYTDQRTVFVTPRAEAVEALTRE